MSLLKPTIHNRLTQPQVRDVLEQFLSGATGSELYAKYGIPLTGLIKLVKYYGFKRDDGGGFVEKQDVSEQTKLAVSRAMNRKSFFWVAGEDTSPQSTKSSLFASRPTIRTPLFGREYKQTRNLSIVNAYMSGKTTGELANEYGMSITNICRIINLFGTTKEIKAVAKPVKAAKPTKEEKLEIRRKLIEYNERSAEMQIWGFAGSELAQLAQDYGPKEDPRSPMGEYLTFRRSTKFAGSEWFFTFKTWLLMWVESGKWERYNKNRKHHSTIQRVHDEAPFSPHTCVIREHTSIDGSYFQVEVLDTLQIGLSEIDMTVREFCLHLAQYGGIKDPESPINRYLVEKQQVNGNGQTFKQWWLAQDLSQHTPKHPILRIARSPSTQVVDQDVYNYLIAYEKKTISDDRQNGLTWRQLAKIHETNIATVRLVGETIGLSI